MNTNTNTRYIVMTARAAVPGNRRTYDGQRVALVEVDGAFNGTPAAISERAPGVRRIIRDYGLGGAQAVVAAEAMKTRLEAQRAAGR